MISLSDQIACVEREIRMRRRVYPKWVAARRMEQAEADHEIAAMAAILENLRAQKPDLFRQETVEGAPV